jgi:hypothetical protein
MSKQFGNGPFKKGFQIVIQNKRLICEEDGEQRLVEKLKPLISDPRQLE